MSDDGVQTTDRCPCGSGAPYEDCCEGRDDMDEMLEEWMQNGYRILEEREKERDAHERAVNVWWASWKNMRDDLPASVSDRASVDEETYDFDFYFQKWVIDLAQLLQETAEANEEHAEIGVQFNRQTIELFSDDKDLFLRNRKQDLVRHQFLTGRHDEAIKTAGEMIEDEPQKAAGYAVLAEVHASSPEPDYERAAEVLEDGLDRVPEKEAKAFDFEERIEEWKMK